MTRLTAFTRLFLCLAGMACLSCGADSAPPKKGGVAMEIILPSPAVSGTRSLEEVLASRRSVRSFAARPLTIGDLSRLLWAAQGITAPRGFRTAPSAGALYPLDVYVTAGRVEGLDPGVYRYLPEGHRLARVSAGDSRDALARAALGQGFVAKAPAVFVIAAVYGRVTIKYRARGERYAQMEAGHAAQNLCLQAEALGLGTVVVGAFDDAAVRRAMGMERNEQPLCLMPLGTPSR